MTDTMTDTVLLISPADEGDDAEWQERPGSTERVAERLRAQGWRVEVVAPAEQRQHTLMFAGPDYWLDSRDLDDDDPITSAVLSAWEDERCS